MTTAAVNRYLIKAPNTIKTSILLPSSKSIGNRALILNALCNNPELIKNLSVCDDTAVVIKALSEKQGTIDVGAAGTAMRFLTAFFAGQQGTFIITGTERMKHRPIKLLVEALRTVGAQIEYLEKEGFPPLSIKGQTLKGGEIMLDGSVSSQFVSALLMIAPMMTNGLKLHLTGHVISASYIHITTQLMRKFGVTIFEERRSDVTLPLSNQDLPTPVCHTFTVPHHKYHAQDDFTVESDWSAASYWYEMVALSPKKKSTVTLLGLQPDSLQGDSAIVTLFDKLGVNTSFTSTGAVLTKKQPTISGTLNYDFISMPDMAQTLVVTCVMQQIPFRFTGLQSLKIKETDRLTALKTELCKFGYMLEIQDDHTLEWKGKKGKPENVPNIATYEDHRMAMAFAPMSLCIREGIRIDNPEVVTKSYPSFWQDLKKANFTIRPVENANCCSLNETCIMGNNSATILDEIDYFEDEELDDYSGIPSDRHTAKAIEEFSEVLYTMQANEVTAWLHSLQFRNIYLPDSLKDEALLIIEEQRNNE